MLMAAAITSCSGNSGSKEAKNPDTPVMASAKEYAEASASANAEDAATGKPIELGPDDILEFGGAQPAPVVVDFSASWCGPCKQMHPIFERLARKYHGRVVFIYVDIDKAPQLAKQYGITAVPTLLFVDTKGNINRSMGYMDEAELEGSVEAIIEASKTEPGIQPR